MKRRSFISATLLGCLSANSVLATQIEKPANQHTFFKKLGVGSSHFSKSSFSRNVVVDSKYFIDFGYTKPLDSEILEFNLTNRQLVFYPLSLILQSKFQIDKVYLVFESKDGTNWERIITISEDLIVALNNVLNKIESEYTKSDLQKLLLPVNTNRTNSPFNIKTEVGSIYYKLKIDNNNNKLFDIKLLQQSEVLVNITNKKIIESIIS